jgi:ABC-type glutathione transport system ATPase component
MAASCENADLASSAREVQLSVRGLSKAFHGRPAIEDIDFTACRHEFVAVLGPSGAGKTTLFRCITGLLAADRYRSDRHERGDLRDDEAPAGGGSHFSAIQPGEPADGA